MKVFTEENGSFKDKVNYVDDNNRFVGYSLGQCCCEQFEHGICSSIPDFKEKFSYIDVDLTNYEFVDEKPLEGQLYCHYDGGYVAFRIVACDSPDLYVVLENCHNGYYSHGFDYWSGSGSI